MGQKNSTCEDLLERSPTQISPELNAISKKFDNIVDENIHSESVLLKNLKNDDFADVKHAERQQRGRLESGDLPSPTFATQPDDTGVANPEVSNGTFPTDRLGLPLEKAADDLYSLRTSLKPDIWPQLDNPSIAELSQLTALKMMQNFEEFVKLDQFWKSQVQEVEEKAGLDDSSSEKDFRMINYEELPGLENRAASKQDSSTITGEINEVATTADFENDDGASAKLSTEEYEKKLEVEERPEASHNEMANSEAETKSECSAYVSYVDSTATSKDEDDEMLQLRMRVSSLECERDEAMLKLRLAEKRCKACETESKCLEATLDTMQEKLRNIVSDLRSEVKKSKSLERQLTQSLQESNLSDAVETLASAE